MYILYIHFLYGNTAAGLYPSVNLQGKLEYKVGFTDDDTGAKHKTMHQLLILLFCINGLAPNCDVIREPYRICILVYSVDACHK